MHPCSRHSSRPSLDLPINSVVRQPGCCLLHTSMFKRLFGYSQTASPHGFSSTSTNMSDGKATSVVKSEEEWRTQLSPEQFRILRQKGTEPAGTGKYDKHYEEGVYHCAGCGTPLYTSTTKFKSGCGWPAYYDSIPGAVTRHEDRTFGMLRTEITCTACGGHLGHVFKGEGFPTPTDERHCVNSVSLTFNEGDPVVQK
ncbi:unnamed protein product [Rhizoctonia solani]|uniref:Peptide-methionine (R)-S-oxide reductase n=1 Tax=Rhizoctonia solani TaxID=456999 RepID=A0A8H3GRY8_9AGAM|nr:unnamed protein product [Rhizoctonia solani]